MSDNRLFLVYDPAFDDMDAEGCPAFGYVLLFNEADAALAATPPDFSTYQIKLAQARELVRLALAQVGG